MKVEYKNDCFNYWRFMWPIIREMIKTAIENKQKLIIEGCYIPFGWEKDFEKEYRIAKSTSG